MKHIKLFEGFLNEASNGNNMLHWSKLVDGYPEATGLIVDKDYNILEIIDRIFDEKSGDYSQETKDKMAKHGIKGSTFGKNADYHIVSTGNNERKPDVLTPEEAVKRFKEDIDTQKRISDFLTPEKTKEILDQFKKNENEEFNEFISIEDEKLFKKVVDLLTRKKFKFTTDASDKAGLIQFDSKKEYDNARTVIFSEYRGQFHILRDIDFSYED